MFNINSPKIFLLLSVHLLVNITKVSAKCKLATCEFFLGPI